MHSVHAFEKDEQRDGSPIAGLRLGGVRFGYPGSAFALGPVDALLWPGRCTAIIGPNGSGKSTLLALLAGLVPPTTGDVLLLRFPRDRQETFTSPHGQDSPNSGAPYRSNEIGPSAATAGNASSATSPGYAPPIGTDVVESIPLAAVSARRRSRHMAYLPQNPPYDLDATAYEVVLMGRYPHRSLGLFESPHDHEVARRCMELTQTLAFSARPLRTLSGGEAQRVHLAAALAQEPSILLLDEPTASLDMHVQMIVFGLLTSLARRRGVCVVAVLHDVNLAAQFCAHVLLLDGGQVAACGQPKEVLIPSVLEPVYRVKVMTLTCADAPDRHYVVPRPPGADGGLDPC